jgi:hypothetical protein
MTKLVDALRTEDVLTENGMTTNSTSLNNCVDLFFQIGAMRGQDKTRLINSFTKAYGENPLVAMKLLFWARDIRGGAGERQIFRDIVSYMAKNHKASIAKNIQLISEFGRWDDVLSLLGTGLESAALETIATGLANKNGLCAKWMPRPSVNSRDKKAQAELVRKHLKLTPKEYRKMLSELSNTVEQAMCAKNWEVIEYSKLPSRAMADYMKAFSKNDSIRFQAYMDALDKGETKINAGAVYPYDVVKSMKNGVAQGANAQWNALPNYMIGNTERLMPMCDVSGSMDCPAGQNPNVSCLDVCISLGLYISERNEGAFKDAFMTFSARPEIQVLKGTLSERYAQLHRAQWDMNTNLEAAFKMLLNKAVTYNVPELEMPTMIVIFSDMQFDRCGSDSWNPTAQQMIEAQYTKAGYKIPKVVFWNLNAHNSDSPVRFDKQNTALVSGFSPSLLTSLLAGKDLTPISMMLEVVNSERYSKVTI